MAGATLKAGSTVITVLLCSSILFGEEEKETKLTLDQVPAAVQAAIKNVVGSNMVEDISKEMEDGKTVYEVEFTANDVDHAASLSEDGKVLEEEMEVAVKDLPPAVMKALKEAAGQDSEIEEAEKVVAEGKTFYEAEVESGGATFEMKVGEDGKVMSKEKSKDDDEEDDDKSEKGEDKDHHEKK